MMVRARSTALYAAATRYPSVHQFVKYALVGLLNVGVGFVIYNILRTLKVSPLYAQGTGFLLTSVQSFFLNKHWSFRDTGRHSLLKGYLVFVSLTVVGMGLNLSAFRILLIELHRFGRIGENLALLGAIPVSVLWNFFAYRRWTFSSSSAEAPDAA